MDQTTTILIVVAALLLVAAILILLLRGGKRVAEVAPEPTEEVPAAAAEPVALPVAAGPPDPLTRLKGLGPRAAAQLEALGITRYDQLGALDAAQADAIDAQMGTFQGRLARDRWIEQARYLAADDVAGFEAEFGKLG